jgi:hypothetical protein
MAKKDPDYELLVAFAKKTAEIRRLKAKNAVVFSELAALEKESLALEKSFKDSVRRRSVPGQTVTLYDDELARVTVSGPVAAVSYDVAVARRAWPSAVLDAVLTVDDKKCRALVEGGRLALRTRRGSGATRGAPDPSRQDRDQSERGGRRE